MSDVPGPELSHEGAWTEDAFLALDTAGRRIELIDGSLLVGPTADDPHARAVAAVRAALQAVLPDGLEVTGPVALRLSPGRILVPDLVVATRPESRSESGSGSATGEVRDSSVALIVIDVVGRGHGVADRWFKPQLYAGSRVPYAVLVDHDEPFAVASMLIGGRYHEYAAAEGYGVLRLEEPFPLDLDLADLTVGASAVPSPAADTDTDTDTAGSTADGDPTHDSAADGTVAVDGESEAGEYASAAPDGGQRDEAQPDPREPGSGFGDADGSAPGPAADGPENGARPRHELNGSSTTDPDPPRSHPDEDHSVHA